MATFLSTFASSGLTTTPAVNVAVGAEIAYMREIFGLRDGSINNKYSITRTIDLQLIITNQDNNMINQKSKIIINNLFEKHTARRYTQKYVENIKSNLYSYKNPFFVIIIRKLDIMGVISWSCLGIGIISFMIVRSLVLFQHTEQNRSKHNEIITNMTNSSSKN
jgi:hypothetical protein